MKNGSPINCFEIFQWNFFKNTYSNLPHNCVGPYNCVGVRLINKRVGHVGRISSHLCRWKSGFEGKTSEINKRVGPNRLCRCFFPQKIIRFAAQLFGRSEYVLNKGQHVEVGNLWQVQVGSFLWLVQVGNLWQIWEVIVLWLVQVDNF